MVSAAAALTGCVGPANPSFDVSLHDARTDLRRMAEDPAPLPRPVLVLGGYGDPGVGPGLLADDIRDIAADPDRVHELTFFVGAGTFDACRERVLDAAPRTADGELAEVDVVAISMGGLIARHAARSTDDDDRALPIARLFTISTPHRGANLAALPTLDARVSDMRADATFMSDLNAAARPYELVAYGRLNDWIVGVENTAPPGETPIWVAPPLASPSHLMAARDPRLRADLLRRLREEAPLASVERAPLPGGERGRVIPNRDQSGG